MPRIKLLTAGETFWLAVLVGTLESSGLFQLLADRHLHCVSGQGSEDSAHIGATGLTLEPLAW